MLALDVLFIVWLKGFGGKTIFNEAVNVLAEAIKLPIEKPCHHYYDSEKTKPNK